MDLNLNIMVLALSKTNIKLYVWEKWKNNYSKDFFESSTHRDQ